MAVDWRRNLRWYRRKLADMSGFRQDQWGRVLYIDEWREFLGRLGIASRDALEISPGPVSHWRNLGFRSYRSVQFPDFDITRQVLPDKFDVIIAEHVFEHLRQPYQAAQHVRQMLRDNGVFLIATPFLIRVHGVPKDYTRWTPDGLAGFLEDCGFTAEIGSWGNRAAVHANFARWARYGWGIARSLRNEADFPISVWAYARPAIDASAHNQPGLRLMDSRTGCQAVSGRPLAG